MKAIILAAGLGSRLRKITKKNHKSLIKIGNQTILERIIYQLELCGVKKINIICGHQKKIHQNSTVIPLGSTPLDLPVGTGDLWQ